MGIGNSGVARIREQLFATRSGEQAHALLDDLIANHPREAIAVLIDYARSGPIAHVRTHATARAADLATANDARAAAFFEQGLLDPKLAYWSIKGLVRVAGKASFPRLAALALDTAHPRAERAHAIRELALSAGQRFIRGLPADPGYWKDEAFPLPAFKAWVDAGFPTGPGFAPPAVSPRLNSPANALERAATRLEARLSAQRAARQDPANPSDWLVPANPADLEAICARWKLPATYLAFLRDFSPLLVTVDSDEHPEGIDLFGAADLIGAQSGYAYNPVERREIEDWPRHLLVIASHGGDPWVLDLGRSDGEDAPVLFAEHGAGEWNFEPACASFLGFLENLAGPTSP